jgi:hypothetical protein
MQYELKYFIIYAPRLSQDKSCINIIESGVENNFVNLNHINVYIHF